MCGDGECVPQGQPPGPHRAGAANRAGAPAAFLSVLGQGHGEYLTPGRPGFDQLLATTTDFLRWTLYDDREAARRLPADALRPGVTALDDRLRP